MDVEQVEQQFQDIFKAYQHLLEKVADRDRQVAALRAENGSLKADLRVLRETLASRQPRRVS